MVTSWQRLLAVGGGLGGEAPRPHQLGQPGTGRRVVLDDQHALGGVPSVDRHTEVYHRSACCLTDCRPAPRRRAATSASQSPRTTARCTRAGVRSRCCFVPAIRHSSLIVAALAALGVPSGEPKASWRHVRLSSLSASGHGAASWTLCLFLRANGDRLRDVFLGAGAIGRELALGVACVPLTFMAVISLLVGASRSCCRSLHNVAVNPFAPCSNRPG